MSMFAQKHTARELAERAAVPVLAGSPLLNDAGEALRYARDVGLPVLLKATGGGGGIGIHICRTEEEVSANFASAARQGAAAFGDAGVFVEKYVERARHIEVQIFGDGAGGVVAFPERECSIQRRHQKVCVRAANGVGGGWGLGGLCVACRHLLRRSAGCLVLAHCSTAPGSLPQVLEESPSPFVGPELRAKLQGAAVRLGQLAKYR